MLHFKRIVELITTGKLDDALRDDFLGTIYCAALAIVELLEMLGAEDHHPIGNAPQPEALDAAEVNGLLADLATNQGVQLPAMADASSINSAWIKILLPILWELFQKWLDKQTG